MLGPSFYRLEIENECLEWKEHNQLVELFPFFGSECVSTASKIASNTISFVLGV